MILLVDKPAGMTSFGVVARLRRVVTEKRKIEAIRKGETPPKREKVGHTGTLDPFATGLLIVMTGKDTKKCQEYLKKDKTYEATICLGKTSTTGDVEGEITEISEVKPSKAEVEKAVQSYQGKITQKLPAYSAVKVDGERAYKLARRGVEVEMPEREVEVYAIEVLDYNYPELKIRAHVSSGTYIRTLGEDIGKKLGVGGYLTALRRTKTGIYGIENAEELDVLMEKLAK